MAKLSFKSNAQPKLASISPRKPEVRVARSTVGAVLARRLFVGLGWTFAAAVVMYLCFVVTIVRVVPAGDLGFVPVKNLTYEGGSVPRGEVVLASLDTPQGTEMLDYLRQAFVPTSDAVLVRVEAGPWGEFGWEEPGIVTLGPDNELLRLTMDEAPESTALSNTYLAECVAGACTPGEGLLIRASHIIGDPLGKGK